MTATLFKLLGVSAAAALILCAAVAAETDFFAGRWKVDPFLSAAVVRCCMPDEDVVASQVAHEELLTIEIAGRHVHAVDDVAAADGSHRISEYGATYNDGHWHPFKGSADGQTGGTIMVVRADDRTEISIRRAGDGRLAGVMLRRVATDGRRMAITSLDRLGKVKQSIVLNKE